MDYKYVSCIIEKSCRKCGNTGHTVAARSLSRTNLYCAKCGAFIKHTSKADERNLFITNTVVNENTPKEMLWLYAKSLTTMTR